MAVSPVEIRPTSSFLLLLTTVNPFFSVFFNRSDSILDNCSGNRTFGFIPKLMRSYGRTAQFGTRPPPPHPQTRKT